MLSISLESLRIISNIYQLVISTITFHRKNKNYIDCFSNIISIVSSHVFVFQRAYIYHKPYFRVAPSSQRSWYRELGV